MGRKTTYEDKMHEYYRLKQRAYNKRKRCEYLLISQDGIACCIYFPRGISNCRTPCPRGK